MNTRGFKRSTGCALIVVIVAVFATGASARNLRGDQQDVPFVASAGQRALTQLPGQQQPMGVPGQQMQMGGMPQQQLQGGAAGGIGGGAGGAGAQQPGGLMGAQGSAFYPDQQGGGMQQPIDPNLPLHLQIHGHVKRHAENIHAKVKEVQDRNPDMYYIALFFIAIGFPIIFYFVRAYNSLRVAASSRIVRLREQAEEAERAKTEELKNKSEEWDEEFKKKQEQTEQWMEITQLVQKGQTVREKEMEAEFHRKELALKEKFSREKEEITQSERAKNEELKQQNRILISAIETNESLIEEKGEELAMFQNRVKSLKERDDHAVETMLLSSAEAGSSSRNKGKYNNIKSSIKALR